MSKWTCRSLPVVHNSTGRPVSATLYSRVGFSHRYPPPSQEKRRFELDLDDLTDSQTAAAKLIEELLRADHLETT